MVRAVRAARREERRAARLALVIQATVAERALTSGMASLAGAEVSFATEERWERLAADLAEFRRHLGRLAQ